VHLASTLLLLHAVIGSALLGAITHQVVAVLRNGRGQSDSFVNRYVGVNYRYFTGAIVVLFVAQFILGALIYPAYRLNARVAFEEMSLGWAVGLFEMKEHFAGIGLMILPLYASSWRANAASTHPRNQIALSLLLAFIVWWDFIVGHVLNNIRGLE
jgi:hypothetical protein